MLDFVAQVGDSHRETSRDQFDDFNAEALQDLLCQRLCEDIVVDRRPDGNLMLRTHFRFPDGDGFPIHISPAPSGGIRLSDRGHTLMHISYDHDVDAFLDGTRGALLERIVAESGLQQQQGAFCMDTTPEQLPAALFQLGQALTRIYDLTFLSRSNVGSTFYDDLSDCLADLVDESKIMRDYQPDVPNAKAYTVDYRIEGSEEQLFLFGVPNRDKARLTTIMLSHYHRYELAFESIIVFEDQTAMPRLDLARLSDVGGDMISSLDAQEDFNRKLLRRIAA